MQKFILSVLLFLLLLTTATADFNNGDFSSTYSCSAGSCGTGLCPSSWTASSDDVVCICDWSYRSSPYSAVVNDNGNWIAQDIDLTNSDNITFYIRSANTRNCDVYIDGVFKERFTTGTGYPKRVFDTSTYSGIKTVKFQLASIGYFNIDDVVLNMGQVDVITLDQTSYNDPENIQMDAELVDYDPTHFSYTTLLYGYTYGGWGVLTQVDYNESTAMTASTKSIIADINSDWYDLPLYIKAVITRFNKTDYTTTEIAESGMVYYHVAEGYTYATLEFNQSYYTDPEKVAVNYSIDGMDTGNFTYWIEVMGNDGEWNTWLGVNEEYIELSSSDGQSVFTINKQWMSLPMDIRAYLYVYNKATGSQSAITNTQITTYNPQTIAPGSVWTNKDSYNVTEIVTIYTDTADGGYLMVDKRNDPLYDSYTIYSGLSHVKFALQTSHVGTWDVYLYENSVITNSTVFTVLADNDTAYFSWWGDVQKGEAAYYDYVATSSNSVISIYDGVGEKQYSFNATAGYNEGQISTMPGVAGNWTGSLYDNGVYYNSSLEVYASESWIRFVDDAYYLGDTIEIEYFIIDPEYKIRLRDGLCQYGGRSTILTWMPGSFHTGQRGTLEITLSNDNEFGLQVETNFESGYYLPGEWEVEASGMTQSGYGFTDDTTHVYASGKTDPSDPADTSNEMINIFFSPEGVFLLFTACLTMMGLVAVHHPAGGGAGAVVGVGFGVFFKVLPVWMLLLMVIALVVLAGVAVAVHFKGK